MPTSPTSPGRRGSYFLGSSTFSVYEEMARQLREEGWRRKNEMNVATADLILGDRFQIPYSLLRGERMALSSLFHGTRWINYFEGSHRLTLKACMVKLMKETDTQWANWLPESYAIGGDQLKCEDERQALLEAVAAQPETVWIVKPSSGAKGRRIVLLHAADVPEWLASLSESSKAMYVVQRYVERPLLLSHNRKFDMRVWVLLMSPYSVYAYAQASCRTASASYDMSDIRNVHAHLTNHCLQTDAEHFGEYEEGNEMWLPQLQAFLTSIGKPPDILVSTILPQVSQLVTRTLVAMMPEMAVPSTESYRCFQLFGYDIILTEDLEVKLLEINGSPGIAERHLQPLVRSMRDILGADSKSSAASTPVENNKSNSSVVSPTTSSRDWRLDDDGFVLLWKKGDPVPPGLLGVN
ncbi:tubulin-tyrosine ligase-like protein [Leptomonas pyrrhocoris]|uniref:Tubulin--tyrosine ligase n=1 Tax=Leptomonas pyrrhocoris TaxID=157538 RepID=A0A0N0VH28_LEPPY|nr:tubulin-tyrosine ligase-like protein [Leptomonas pyrrhocoris]KPA84184.1 tubulin-tyrosine ligase-like protein [Leptomonas pyrrhocoris]|eukprot:XP_015662623.1 tubulin-tyrosine ligase-like protein [Leptomonas pyrrhocoris]